MNLSEQTGIELEQLRTDLVCAYHVLDLEGQGSGLGGHVTARVQGEDAFWTHPFGIAFEEVRVDDLIKLDFNLNLQAGSGRVNPTLIFHSRIYQARPDVRCVVHTHADSVTALTTATNTRDRWATLKRRAERVQPALSRPLCSRSAKPNLPSQIDPART